MDDFGDYLKRCRDGKDLTQKELCRRLEVSYRDSVSDSTISRWENGKERPSQSRREVIKHIAQLLELDDLEMNELLTKAGLAPFGSSDADIDIILARMPERYEKTLFLHERGWDEKSIGEKLDIPFWDVRTDLAKATNEKVVDGLIGARRRHLERIYDQVEKIRECLTDIQAEERELRLGTLNKAGPLMINEYDWRLDPIRWRELVTPDFTMLDAWDYDLRMAVSHMRKSSFFKNLGRLRHKAKWLACRYDELAKTLEKEGTFEPGTWEALQHKSRFRLEITRTPVNPKPAQSDYRPYYNEQTCAKVMNEFSRLDSDIPKAISELNELLKQLYVDLRHENIDPIIESGSCDKCPQS